MAREARPKVQIMGRNIATGNPDDVSVDSSGGAYLASGSTVIGVVKTSGEVTKISGEAVKVAATEIVRSSDIVLINNTSGGNSLAVSGAWCSGEVHSVIIKSLSGNNDIFIGDSGCRPYSGHGFLLSAEEAITIDIRSIPCIYAVANSSGNRLTYLGTDY